MDRKIVYGRHLIIDADRVIPAGALYIEADTIVDYGSYGEITGKYSADETLGSADSLVMPGLINAHGHGKGLTDFQRGQLDDTLETWKWRSYPPVDPYYDTLWAGIQLLETGVTTTMHNHGLVYPEAYQEEFEGILRAYRETGLRVALAPTLNTENVFVYGDGVCDDGVRDHSVCDDESFIRSLPEELQRLCRNILNKMEAFGEKEYFLAVQSLQQRFHSPRVQIMHGPLAPQWVRREALQEIKRQAAELNMRIHIHVQQTQLQKLYSLKRHGKSLIAYLADLGFLGPEVTCGHCVWISAADIQTLAETGASVTHHPGCNLRVRNGISPVFELLRRGVIVGLGMDEKEAGDDKDFLAEMRLASKLHRLPTHGLDSPHLLPRDVFRLATAYGARVLGFDPWVGTLERGKQADVVLLDLEAMSAPFAYPEHNPLDLLLYRGKADHVQSVLIGGEVVLKDRRLTRLDRQEVVRKLRETLPADYAGKFKQANAPFPALRAAIASYFQPWHEEIARWERDPFYFLNQRN